MVGAPGTVAGATGVAVTGVEAGPSPMPLLAVTLSVYWVPLVSPETWHVSGPLVQPQLKLSTPSVAVTVYALIGSPPSEAGAVQLTSTTPSPGAADTMVGAPGTVAGATGVAATGVEAGPSPMPLLAVTLSVYWVPLVSPETGT